MAKMKQLSQAIRVASSNGLWPEVEQMIEQMTAEDFAVTYDKPGDHPLVQIMDSCMCYSMAPIAESIIKKNPVFAAKAADYRGQTILHGACRGMSQEDAVKIIELLLPYMSQETILGSIHPLHNTYITFLHVAAQKKYYKVAASISPELIGTIIQNSVQNIKTSNEGVAPSPYSLIDFLKNAVHFYDSQISFHPQEADNYFRKGVILQGMGKNEKAIKCYQKAIGLDPTYADKIEGVELSTLAVPTVTATPDTTAADDREAMKAKIAELTQELSKLMQTTTALVEEVTFLRGSLKVVEEHKGQAPAEPPSYEEEVAIVVPALPDSLPPDIALVGDADVVYHA